MFGAAVGRQLDEAWRLLDRPGRFVLREYGAGSGTLAATIVTGLRADRSGLAEALVYDPVEINDHRRSEIAARVGLPPIADRQAVGGPDSGAGRFSGAVLANEFLDALPVHRVEWRKGRLLERFVAWDAAAGRLAERPGRRRHRPWPPGWPPTAWPWPTARWRRSASA